MNDNLRGLLSIRRMDRVPNAWRSCFYSERIDEIVCCWFGHLEKMENDKIAKRVYMGVCIGSCLVGQPWKRWIDSVNRSLKKKREVWMLSKQEG